VENIKISEEYQAYMSSDIDSYSRDQEFLIDIFKKFIADDDTFEQFSKKKICTGPAI